MGVMRRRQFLSLTALAAASFAGRPAQRRSSGTSKGRVIVVGGGFAGSSCALELRRIDPAIDVAIIDPDARYVTCPMSNEVIAGMRNLDSITVDRAGLARAGVRWIQSIVTSIDSGRRTLRLAEAKMMEYDRLVVAPGIRFVADWPQGYNEQASQRMPHAWKAGVQTALLAKQVREMKDGGVVAISVPSGLMRCPPGPYERASLIAHYLKQHKPRSKVLIFDANNRFPKQDVFAEVWQELYPGMIEWIPLTEDGTVIRVDAQNMTLYTSGGAHPVAVANVIPPQAPGMLALETGLSSGHGWCPVKSESFESRLIPDIHVIGDACIADAMPKSASAAHSQAKQCAAAISAAFAGRDPPAPMLDSVCYSLLAPDKALAIRGSFRSTNGEIRQLDPTSETDAVAPPPASAQQASEAGSWYKTTVADSFGA